MSLKEFEERVEELTGFTMSDIASHSRKHKLVYLKMIYFRIGTQEGLHRKVIAEKLNIKRCVTYHYQHEWDIQYEYNKEFRELADIFIK